MKGFFTMMVSNGFNFPPNGYYNPPKPPITTKNYQNALTYGDDKRYGGNGDGKLDATELTSIKKVFDYAADYYKNMYQQSGDVKYMAWSDHYSRDSKATDNMSKNFSVFATNLATVPGGGDYKITKEGIEQLANKDGNGNTISLNDLAKTRFSGFQNDKLATTHYQDVVKYGDDKRYGGNGDGKLDGNELSNIKKTFDYAADYYKNQATTATTAEDKAKFTAWSNYYANDAKAAVNIQSEQNLFMQDGASSSGSIGGRQPVITPLNLTMQRVQALAGKDGNANTLSIQDLGKAQFPNFVDNQRQMFPMPYGGNPQYGGYQPQYAGYQQPIDYSQQQAMYYNQQPQYAGYQQAMYYNQQPQYDPYQIKISDDPELEAKLNPGMLRQYPAYNEITQGNPQREVNFRVFLSQRSELSSLFLESIAQNPANGQQVLADLDQYFSSYLTRIGPRYGRFDPVKGSLV
jgi:hypothetical protein